MNKKYSKETIVKALKMYTEGRELEDIRKATGLEGAWKSMIYAWRKKAGIAKRPNMKNKRWSDIKQEVETI